MVRVLALLFAIAGIAVILGDAWGLITLAMQGAVIHSDNFVGVAVIGIVLLVAALISAFV